VAKMANGPPMPPTVLQPLVPLATDALLNGHQYRYIQQC